MIVATMKEGLFDRRLADSRTKIARRLKRDAHVQKVARVGRELDQLCARRSGEPGDRGRIRAADRAVSAEPADLANAVG